MLLGCFQLYGVRLMQRGCYRDVHELQDHLPPIQPAAPIFWQILPPVGSTRRVRGPFPAPLTRVTGSTRSADRGGLSASADVGRGAQLRRRAGRGNL